MHAFMIPQMDLEGQFLCSSNQ